MVDGVNLYMYVRGNPVRLHDPSGMAADTSMVLPNVDVKADKPNELRIQEGRVKDAHFDLMPQQAVQDKTTVASPSASEDPHAGDVTRKYGGLGPYDLFRPEYTVNYSKNPVGSLAMDVLGVANNGASTIFNVASNTMGMTIGQVPEEVWGGMATLDATMPGWGGVVMGGLKEIGIGGLAASRLMRGLAKTNLGEMRVPEVLPKPVKLPSEPINDAMASLNRSFAKVNEGVTEVYHGSIDNYTDILNNGLSYEKGTTYISRDLQASRDAIGPNRFEVANGIAKDPGLITSRIPTEQFESILAPAERQYGGFYGSNLESSEIQLRVKEQFDLFNRYMVRQK